MISNLKSFLFDRALDLSEDDLNAILFGCAQQQSADMGEFSAEILGDFLATDVSDDLGDLKTNDFDAEQTGVQDRRSHQHLLSDSGVALMEGDVDDEGGATTPFPDAFAKH